MDDMVEEEVGAYYRAMREGHFTTKQLAEALHVHRNTINNWVKAGLLTPERIGPRRLRRYPASEVERFVKEGSR